MSAQPGWPARRLALAEAWLSRGFGGSLNPAHFLGALTIYFFWIALVSGIYLFIFYRTSLDGAWQSVEYLSREQWYLGGIMRSMHRYASDAAMITLLAHALRELIRGRHRGPRWFSWLTGAPLVWIVLVFGITGYWMVWDEVAQLVALSTARLLDWLPIFTDPMSRNFISPEAVSSRLFTLIAFIHLVGLPIVAVLAIWFHLLRIKLPRINPPRPLMVGSGLLLLALAVAVPVHSHGPADLERVPELLQLDWFYLAMFPLQEATSEGVVWALGTGLTVLTLVLPWLPPRRRLSVAEVYLPDCTGCGFCAEDCPYGAIDMVPRSDGRNFEFEARVNESLCVSCGICTGSCPSSSLFRARQPLTTGIDLPHFPLETMRMALPAADPSANQLLVLGCARGVRSAELVSACDRHYEFPCIGMVAPTTIDFALRRLDYQGVVISGCDACDCHDRLGNQWIEQRIARQRQPGLRRRVDRDRILVCWLKVGEEKRLGRQIDAFRGKLTAVVGESEA